MCDMGIVEYCCLMVLKNLEYLEFDVKDEILVLSQILCSESNLGEAGLEERCTFLPMLS